MPHAIAQRGGKRREPRIDAGVALAAGQAVAAGDAAGGVAVDGVVAALVGRTRGIASRRHELHLVAARRQAAEAVIARGVGRRRRQHRRTRAVQQLDGDAGNPGLADILDAVIVGIGKHPVADRGQLIEARIHRRDVLPRRQRVAAGDAAGGVAVDAVIGALVRRAGEVARRRHELHLVAARRQVAEGVVARGIRRRRRQHGGAGAVQQLDGDAGNPRLAGILQAIGVGIVEHAIAQLRARIAVVAEVGVAGGARGRHRRLVLIDRRLDRQLVDLELVAGRRIGRRRRDHQNIARELAGIEVGEPRRR